MKTAIFTYSSPQWSQIFLPPKSTFQYVSQYLEEFTPQEVWVVFTVRATLSSDPASGDFARMVINLGFNTTCLSFYRSVDKQWSRFSNLGQFYSIANHGQILSCEVNPKSSGCRSSYCFWFMVLLRGRVCREASFSVPESCFVDNNRALEDIPLDGTLHHTVSFKLYEIDLKERSLIEIKSIGDYTLFVGFNNAIRLRFQRKPKPGIACTFLMITMMQYLEWLNLKGD